MPNPTEYWEVSWVQYQPNRDTVLLGGAYVVVGASGRLVSEMQNLETSQGELMSFAAVGAETWADAEVAALVAARLSIPCVFVPVLPPVVPPLVPGN